MLLESAPTRDKIVTILRIEIILIWFRDIQKGSKLFFNFQPPFSPTFCSVPNLPMKPLTPTVLQLKNTVLPSRNTALQFRNTVPPPSQSTPTVLLLHHTKNQLLLTRLPLTLHPPTRPPHLPMMPPLIHTDPPPPTHCRPMLLPTKHHLVV